MKCFPDGVYQDVAGLWKVLTLEEIPGQTRNRVYRVDEVQAVI